MAVQVFVAACGLSVAVASGGRSGAAPASHCRLLGVGHVGSVAPWTVGSSWNGDRAHVPCVGRLTPDHWTTGEVLEFFFLFMEELQRYTEFPCAFLPGSHLLLCDEFAQTKKLTSVNDY